MVYTIPKGSATAYGDVFKNITGNVLLDEANRDRIKVISTGVWWPNKGGLTSTGQDEYTFVKSMYIPHKRLYKFGPADNTTNHNQDDLYLCVLCYDTYGSVVADNIGYIQMFSEFQYKDP